jgi:hypothetical protein
MGVAMTDIGVIGWKESLALHQGVGLLLALQ